MFVGLVAFGAGDRKIFVSIAFMQLISTQPLSLRVERWLPPNLLDRIPGLLPACCFGSVFERFHQ
jgi:hypothetical protein